MILTDNQKYMLYLFYSYYLFNKDYINDRYNEILNIINRNWTKDESKESEILAKYIDYIFDKHKLTKEDSEKYTEQDILFNNIYSVYGIYLKEIRKFKLINLV
jgi:hypothetical protein